MPRKNLNLLVVSSYFHPAATYGGPVSSIHKLYQLLRAKSCGVSIFTTDANGQGDLKVPLGNPVPVDGFSVTYFPRWWFGRVHKPSNLFFSPELGRRLRGVKSGEHDLVNIHSVWGDPGRMAVAAGRRIGMPYIYYTHGAFEPWALRHHHWKKRIYLALIERRILNGAAGIVVCNNAEAEQLHLLGIRAPMQRIPWGVDLPDPENLPSRHRLEELWPALRDRPFGLFLSRLHPKKGLELLISAFQALHREFPDWLLVIGGPDEGGYRTQVEQMVHDQDLEDRVIFTGWVTGEAKSALLAHAELFVLPSFSEGFPMVVAEGLGYGLPMLITTTCYVPEVGEEGAGLVVPPDRKALTLALRQMLKEADLRQQCARQALEVARRHFTWESVVEQSLAFFHAGTSFDK
jgi:glycosyltransferase involved in cell wall biosynthesis